jgi:uncharacterized protein YegL
MANPTQRDQVFISYSHKDKKLFDKLQTFLKPLVRGKKISVWDDTKIKSGDKWREEIKQAIAMAKVAVLLVSSDFLDSDFIAEHELPPLLEAAEREGLKILWVAVRFSMYEETEIARYQAVNNPTRPLAGISGANREKELVKICKEIKAATLEGSSDDVSHTLITYTEEMGSITPLEKELQIPLHLTPKLPCLLLLDTSGSMSGEPIQALMRGLQSLVRYLLSDPLSLERVDLALITFGSRASIVWDFAPVYEFHMPDLDASGATATGEAIQVGLDLLEQRIDEYKRKGVPYYQPFVLLLTNGSPTDDWKASVNRLHKESSLGKLRFFTVGLEGADMKVLHQISPPGTKPLNLKNLRFSEMFLWLSSSIQSVSREEPTEQIELPSPANWTVI